MSNVASTPDPDAADGAERARPVVLLVEDDDELRLLVTDVLEEAGFEVVGVGDGGAALAKLDGGLAPDVIVLDMMLPHVTGWQFLERRQCNTPVVAYTASGLEADSLDGVRVVRKGADVDDLIAVLRETLTAPAA